MYELSGGVSVQVQDGDEIGVEVWVGVGLRDALG